MYVILDIHNGGTSLELLESARPITMKRVVKYYEDVAGITNWDRNGLQLLNPAEIETINLDRK